MRDAWKEFQDVGEFHTKFGLPVYEENAPIRRLEPDVLLYRVGFLIEELTELIQGYQRRDLAAVADGLVDLVYIAHGTLHFMNATPYWNELERFTTMRNAGVPRFIDEGSFGLYVNGCIVNIATTGNPHQFQDGLMGVLLTIYYLSYDMNLPWEKLWSEVQRANLAKERGTTEKRGHNLDVRKPPGWQPPRIEEILIEAGWDPAST